MELPKYSLLEIERRWVVEAPRLPDISALTPARLTDCYLPDSQLRLRKVEEAGRSQFKLSKKYRKHSPYAEAICNIYLNEAEYQLLRALGGTVIEKRRSRLPFGGVIDQWIDYPELIFFEIEFSSESEAESYQPPSFVGAEVESQWAVFRASCG